MAKISYMNGNIFNSKVDAIVTTVNCVGFMGKGMALECALRHPEVENEYQIACKDNQIKIGSIYWIILRNGQHLALFPTKNDYKHNSKMSYITSGLQSLVESLYQRGIKSVALPKLGSELGGLDWNLVEVEIMKYFEHVDVDLEIWSYGGAKQDEMISTLIYKLQSDFSGVRKLTGVSEELLKKILAASENTIFLSVSDLLRIKGMGKSSVKKLISVGQSPHYVQNDLFD